MVLGVHCENKCMININKKLIKRWESPNVTWVSVICLLTYVYRHGRPQAWTWGALSVPWKMLNIFYCKITEFIANISPAGAPYKALPARKCSGWHPRSSVYFFNYSMSQLSQLLSKHIHSKILIMYVGNSAHYETVKLTTNYNIECSLSFQTHRQYILVISGNVPSPKESLLVFWG